MGKDVLVGACLYTPERPGESDCRKLLPGNGMRQTVRTGAVELIRKSTPLIR